MDKKVLVILIFLSTTIDIFVFAQQSIPKDSLTNIEPLSNPSNYIQEIDGSIIWNSSAHNIINALNSKEAGVLVTSSAGSPGASASIRIRGNRSVLFENSPLIIVDGMPIDNSSFGNGPDGVDNSNRGIDLNTYDIESISILKSMHANVLYGIRGANGVVLITSKKGIYSSKPKINLNYSFSVSKVNKLPEFQNEYAQGGPVGGVPSWRGPDTGEGFSWGPAIKDLEFDGSNYDYDTSGRLVSRGSGNRQPAKAYDNVGNFFVNGAKHNLNLSVRGGTSKVNYYFSSGFLNQKGVVLDTDFSRKSLKLNVNANITKKLSVGVSVNHIRTGPNNRAQRGANISGVTVGLFRTTPTFDNGNGKIGEAALNDPTTYELPDSTQRSYRAGIYDSPYWSIKKNRNRTKVSRNIAYAFLEYQIFTNLKIGYKLGFDKWSEDRKAKYDVKSASFQTGLVEFNENENKFINSDFTINYTKELGQNLIIDAIVGQNYFTSSFSNVKNFGSGLIIPGNFDLTNTTDPKVEFDDKTEKIVGTYISLDANYKNHVYVNLSVRNDWSSVLPKDKNSTLFLGTSITWDLGNAFLKKKNISLKLRGSWGKTGNIPGTYLTTTYYEPASIGGDGFIRDVEFPQFGLNGFETASTLGNTNLKPEITKGSEIGLDLALFENRIKINYTYYNQKTSNVILPINISSNTGGGLMYYNSGKIENVGQEITLSLEPLQKTIQWTIDLNYSRNKSMVLKLHESVDQQFSTLNPIPSYTLSGFASASSQVIEGHPYGAIWGSRFARDAEGNMIIGNSGWPLRAATDTVLGNPNPDWTMGVRNTLSYKGFTISALLDIRSGGDIWNGTQGIINYFGTSKLTGDQRIIRGYVYNGVTTSGEINNTPVDFANPLNGLGGNKWYRYGFGGLVEENIQDASWIRLRELSISYQIPNKWLNKIGIDNGSISFMGRNLWLKTNYSGIDPETNLTGDSNGTGLDYFNMPNTKSYGFALNFNI